MATDLQGLALIGNALALPKRLEHASRQSAIERALLAANADVLGLSPAQIEAAAPAPGLSWINPTEHPGTYGKILSTVGGVGNVISSLLGSPLEAPRLELSTLASLSGLREKAQKKQAVETYAGTFPDEQSQAAIRAGKTPPKSGTGSMQEIPMLYRQGKARGMSDEEANDYALEQIGVRKTDRAMAQGQRASEIRLSEATQKDVNKQRLAASRVRRLIDPLRGAIDRQLTADSLFGRLAQRGKLFAFKQAPGTVGRAMGFSSEEINALADDIAIIESPGAFAGQILKGLGEDAGRLSDFDIKRVADRMPNTGDAHPVASAKLKVFERMVTELAHLPPGEDGTDIAARAVQEFDRIGTQTPQPANRVRIGTSAAPPAPGADDDFEILDVRPKE